jgi:uncharacterized protein
MWDRWIKTLGLALLCGLCAAAQANTTAPERLLLAQNTDFAPLPPLQLEIEPATPPHPAAPTYPTGPAEPANPANPAYPVYPANPANSASPASPVSPDAPLSPANPAVPLAPAAPAVLPRIRMALLLPLQSSTLGSAAQAVRDGFLAGHAREQAGVTVAVLESGDTPQDVLPAYLAAVNQFDIVIGPLSRFDVAAVAQSGNVLRPTIALAQPQLRGSRDGDVEPALPPRMLVVGLSLEEEARQVADWVGRTNPAAKVFVVSTNTAWQRRTARAFAAQASQAGLAPQNMQLSLADGAVSPSGLEQLKQRIVAEQPEALFVALDAAQARQVRTAIGADVALYGTSQLNPLASADWLTAEAANEMNGARFVDIPWQVQPDHPAVMVYPHPVVSVEQKRSADLERLYALGIDAYRVAHEVAAGNTNFGIDGVTGKLSVSFGNGAPGFQRIETQAVYRDGRVQPLAAP